jgi:hypothetical protein
MISFYVGQSNLYLVFVTVSVSDKQPFRCDLLCNLGLGNVWKGKVCVFLAKYSVELIFKRLVGSY